MTRLPYGETTQGFELAGNLLALHAGSAASRISFQQRATADADWIVGIKLVMDDSAVHADHWERHPRGEEILCLLEGRVEITLSRGSEDERTVILNAGQAFIVPRGHWHRLHVAQAGRLMFITPSRGSEHRRVDGAGTAAAS